jgi:hypothetical protein
MQKNPFFLSGFNEPEIFWTEFPKKKKLNMKFHPNPSSGEPSCSMWTEGHNDSNGRFSQFCERA